MANSSDFLLLHRRLVERYNSEELRTLCAELDIPFDDLGGEGRQGKAREMVLWMQRRGGLDRLAAVLFPHDQASPSSNATARQRSAPPLSRHATHAVDTVDLAIVTAMPEELAPVLDLLGGGEQWEQFVINQFVHYRSRFEFESASLNVVACSLWKYGGNPTTAQILRLSPLQPQMIVMTGICAGWEQKGIHLGDVIIADRAFHLGEGKYTVDGFQPDLRTYQPPPWLLNWLGDFSRDQQWFKHIQTPRPYSLRYKLQLVLCRIYKEQGAYPASEADWKQLESAGVNFALVQQQLLERELITPDGQVTEQGLAELNKLRHYHHGQLAPIPDPQHPSAHYGAFASAEAVFAIDQPFLKPAEHVRNIRAIELEVASLFAAAMEIGVPAFAVKGVSDYGTSQKDDVFHHYAAEAATRWMYEFMRQYGRYLRAS